ncbi:MAG: methyltransferase domain-containing protein, partial [Armatimonadota bacterium]
AMVIMDIMDIKFPDDSFDIIYCSHVLEHVARDDVALAELYRVLKPGGWAILQVPLEGYLGMPVIEVTIEDPAVTDPQQRTELFGQDDHVRRYGRDYQDRLAAAGFAVNVDAFARHLTPQARLRLGVMEEDLYCCTKRPPQTAARTS